MIIIESVIADENWWGLFILSWIPKINAVPSKAKDNVPNNTGNDENVNKFKGNGGLIGFEELESIVKPI